MQSMKSMKKQKQAKSMKSMKKQEQVKCMRKPDYTNMQKKDIPHGHYFKWVAFHSELLRLKKEKCKQSMK